ncbi:tripartite tricarboxylate transporter TctB family protein [Franzmannia qiaohouensis]|uniref:Tripartite tricarboxylate transporter TctB family protein n=1 Tax=Franzmannia qiaohouensis TaxID=1329370 RepID=A0ABU1HG85_9GAMM|nr:tripartite tricarboxylate transporter TctB family protein [Halomonas qiaohouensis]MDR5906485.1 tripartite tricarboxylate transporter TctB family protein [Halomonas qiaohouensis]
MSNVNKPSDLGRQFWISSLVTLSLIAMGLAWAGFGWLKYGVWMHNGPGAGFFPLVMGLGAALLGGYELLRRRWIADQVGLRNLWPAVAMGIAIATIPLFGMVLAMTLFIVMWMALVEHQSWLKSILIGGGAGGVIYLLFGMWLMVAFPQGALIGWLS